MFQYAKKCAKYAHKISNAKAKIEQKYLIQLVQYAKKMLYVHRMHNMQKNIHSIEKICKIWIKFLNMQDMQNYLRKIVRLLFWIRLLFVFLTKNINHNIYQQ